MKTSKLSQFNTIIFITCASVLICFRCQHLLQATEIHGIGELGIVLLLELSALASCISGLLIIFIVMFGNISSTEAEIADVLTVKKCVKIIRFFWPRLAFLFIVFEPVSHMVSSINSVFLKEGILITLVWLAYISPALLKRKWNMENMVIKRWHVLAVASAMIYVVFRVVSEGTNL